MFDKYNALIEDIDWYFETEDALRHARFLLHRGRITLSTYKELSVWAGAAESDLRKLCKIRTRDAIQSLLPF